MVITAEDVALAEDDSSSSQEIDTIRPTVHEVIQGDTARTGPDTLALVTDTTGTDTTLADSLQLPSDSLLSDSLPAMGEETDIECPWNAAALEINGSIYSSITHLSEDSDILGAHIVRCLWWDIDPWRGVNAGDSLYIVYGDEGVEGRENRVVALRYSPVAGASNRAFSVYVFRKTGDNYASHYYSSGLEMMKLLDYMPITTFEEMTGPYGEPRGNSNHAGVDYKAPMGTPVRTCTGGTVIRTDWNFEYNGHCVEVDIGGGYTEIFLHLNSLDDGIAPGAVLSRGDAVGFVGTTGRTSTAPHLHYQINDESANPIDPYIFYGSHRRSLTGADLEEFVQFRDSCDRWMDTAARR